MDSTLLIQVMTGITVVAFSTIIVYLAYRIITERYSVKSTDIAKSILEGLAVANSNLTNLSELVNDLKESKEKPKAGKPKFKVGA